MPSPRLTSLVVAALVAGCAAGRVEAPARAPAAAVAGVEVTARAGAWRGWPAGLPRVVTPVHVTLANRGEVPVRVDVTSFALVLADGTRRAAALPTDIRAVVPEPPPATSPGAGVALGPTRERSGAGWAINEPALDPRADPSLEPDGTWALPSADMLTLALPEGVLPPGGTAAGFVYFERAPRDAGPPTLALTIVDARSGEELGVAAVPVTPR